MVKVRRSHQTESYDCSKCGMLCLTAWPSSFSFSLYYIDMGVLCVNTFQ